MAGVDCVESAAPWNRIQRKNRTNPLPANSVPPGCLAPPAGSAPPYCSCRRNPRTNRCPLPPRHTPGQIPCNPNCPRRPNIVPTTAAHRTALPTRSNARLRFPASFFAFFAASLRLYFILKSSKILLLRVAPLFGRQLFPFCSNRKSISRQISFNPSSNIPVRLASATSVQSIAKYLCQINTKFVKNGSAHQSLPNKSRVYTFSRTSSKSAPKRLAMMQSLSALKRARSFTTLLPKNVAPSSSVGS